MPGATIPFHPVAGVRYFFRDGPRSLRRLRVTRVRPTGEEQAFAIGAFFATVALGIVAFLVAPNRWIGWAAGLLLFGAAPVAAHRIVLYRMRKRVGTIEWITGLFLSVPTFLMLWTLNVTFVVLLVLFGYGSWEWYAFYFPAEIVYLVGVWRFNREVRAARASGGTAQGLHS